MKIQKLLLLFTFIFIFSAQMSSAQFTSDPAIPDNIYNTNIGKVGLGIIPGADIASVGGYGTTKTPFLQIYGISNKTGIYGNLSLPVVKITSPSSTYSLGLGFEDTGYPNFIKYSYISTEARFKIQSTELEIVGTSFLRSKVIIAPFGTYPSYTEINTPGNYRLYVQGGILTEKIKVALSTDAVNWSDFVFAKDYKLRSLYEVETYVKKHHHLPEIPSSEEVYKEGLDLAQMDAKLLMKIEELTLYMIELKKENEVLKSQIDILNKKIK